MATKKSKSLLMSLGLLAVTGIVAALYSTKVIGLVKKVPGLTDIDSKIGENAHNA
jgi:hypothetical protein